MKKAIICPQCGSRHIIFRKTSATHNHWYLHCSHCGNFTAYKKTLTEAKALWTKEV